MQSYALSEPWKLQRMLAGTENDEVAMDSEKAAELTSEIARLNESINQLTTTVFGKTPMTRCLWNTCLVCGAIIGGVGLTSILYDGISWVSGGMIAIGGGSKHLLLEAERDSKARRDTLNMMIAAREKAQEALKSETAEERLKALLENWPKG